MVSKRRYNCYRRCRRLDCFVSQFTILLLLILLSSTTLLPSFFTSNNHNFILGVNALPWMITIDPYDDECYKIKLPSTSKQKGGGGKVLLGSYEMFDEIPTTQQRVTPEPLLVYIMQYSTDKGKDKIVWRSKDNESKGAFRVPLYHTLPGNTGKGHGYWLCFQNSNHAPDNENPEKDHPDHVLRQIGFDYRIGSIIPDVKPSPLLFTADHTDEWRDKSSEIQMELRQLMTHSDYMHMREAKHRKLVEYTFDDIMAWIIIETFIVVLLAICQVVYYQRFLEKKQSLYRKY
jgi:hypothetical protein